MNGRDELDAFLDRVPEHVLVVLDQAYFEYIDDPDYADGDRGALQGTGRRVVVLRTFSKIYGLAGLRVGYGVAPTDVVVGDEQGAARIRRDRARRRPPRSRASTTTTRSRAGGRRTRAGRAQLDAVVRAHGLEPAGPRSANFLFVEVGDGRGGLRARCCAQGVIVRPLGGFGAPGAIRVTVGTSEENDFFAAALGHVFSGVTS